MAKPEIEYAWFERSPAVMKNEFSAQVFVLYRDNTQLILTGCSNPIGSDGLVHIVNPVTRVLFHENSPDKPVDVLIDREKEKYVTKFIQGISRKDFAEYLETASQYGAELMERYISGQIDSSRWQMEFMPVWHALRTQFPSQGFIEKLKRKK